MIMAEIENQSEGTREPLFEGDTGTLTFEERQLLVTLLRGPYLLRSEKPHLWDVLINSREKILSYLNDLFLTLVQDTDLGIAFCRQAATGELQAPPLLRQFTLPFLDSVLIVEMRDRLLSAQAQGEQAYLSGEEIEEILRAFDPVSQSNEKLFKTHVNAVVPRLQRRKLLLRLNDVANLYQVSLVLSLVFNAEEVQALKDAYARKLLQPAAVLNEESIEEASGEL